MIKMSFYDNTLNKRQLLAFVQATDKPIVHTLGFEYRHPTVHREPMTKAEAVALINRESLLDATEEENCLHLNNFTANDMW